MKRKRRNHSASFKAKVAVAAIRGDKTLAELSEQFDVHQNQIQDWRRKLLDQANQVFERPGNSPSESEHKVKELHAKIGELTIHFATLEHRLQSLLKILIREDNTLIGPFFIHELNLFVLLRKVGLIARYQTGRPWTVWRLQSEANLDAIGDDSDVAAVLQVGNHGKDGGAGVQEDRVAILNRVCCLASDPLLSLGIHLNASREGGAGKAVTILQHRAATHTG